MTTLTLRLDDSTFEQITVAAARMGLSRSAYARRALEAMNTEILRQRIATISSRLSTSSLHELEQMDAALADGLDG
jgi:predicted transcriptional regulator